METRDVIRAGRFRLVIVLLAVGWLVGLAVQLVTRAATGYMDILPPQLILGLFLLAGAGAAIRLARPDSTPRAGAITGMAMLGSILIGYALVMALTWNPLWDEGESGETWFTFLLEAWFWVGVPLVAAASLGWLGWRTADRFSAPRASGGTTGGSAGAPGGRSGTGDDGVDAEMREARTL